MLGLVSPYDYGCANILKDQWFLLGMVLVIIVSSQIQVPENQQAVKQVAISYLSGNYCSYHFLHIY